MATTAMSPVDLPQRWRDMVRQLDELGAEGQARAIEWCAKELEKAWQAWETEPLTLQEAAEESGYSPDSLGRLLRSEAIPNEGMGGAPRIQRQHLPRRPRTAARNGGIPRAVTSKEQIARSVADSPKGGSDG
jgi:hypothetical protein